MKVTVYYEGPEVFWERIELVSFHDRPGYKAPSCELVNELIKDRAHRIPVDEKAVRIKARCRKIYAQYKKIIKNGPARSCERCGVSGKIISGHHADYGKPITSLIWLCFSCHVKAHAGHSYQEFFPGLIFEREGASGNLGNKIPILPHGYDPGGAGGLDAQPP